MSEDPLCRTIYSDVVGEELPPSGAVLSSLELPESLKLALSAQFGKAMSLYPPQCWAVENGILADGSDFLISAPTNSGKTLPGMLRLFVGAMVSG